MTKEQMLERATQFMVREYGVPAKMVDEDCKERWHERLGLLVEFIDEICPPDEPKADHEHQWENLVFRAGQLGPEYVDACKCGLWRIRSAEKSNREPGYMGDVNGPGCDPDTL